MNNIFRKLAQILKAITKEEFQGARVGSQMVRIFPASKEDFFEDLKEKQNKTILYV